MRVAFICLFSLVGLIASAQTNFPPSVKILSVQPKKNITDTTMPGINKFRLKAYQEVSGNKMPNAIRIPQQPSFIYKGNNGSGFNIYQSTLDGMAVISPDKDNKSHIPTVGFTIDPKIALATPKQALADSIPK